MERFSVGGINDLVYKYVGFLIRPVYRQGLRISTESLPVSLRLAS